MNKTNFIPKLPFQYNPVKHHLNWILDELAHPEDISEMIQSIKKINSNYVDIYCGSYTPAQLLDEIEVQLKQLDLLVMSGFSKVVHSHGYLVVKLNDASRWVIRKGRDRERYIHLHPARSTSHIVRVHGNSWKTALLIKLLEPKIVIPNLTLVNQLRIYHLGLSPIKNLSKNSRLLLCCKLLQFNV